jgi:ABC-type amino acid transport system permease subunit
MAMNHETNSSNAESADDRRAEFDAYRQEISDRSGHQHTLLTLNLTVLSAVAGFVFSNHADPLVLLLLPVVSSAMGLLWYDHARNIDSLGDHIRLILKQFSSYEERIARLEKSELRRVPMMVALLILFVVTPIAGLVVPFSKIHGVYWFVWWTGAVMSVVCVFFFAAWIREGFRG